MINILTAEHKEKIKYLSQYRYLNAEIDRKIKYMESCKSKIFNVTGTLSDMPRSGNRSNVIEDGIVNINEIEQTINQDIDKLVNLRAEIESKIDTIQDLKLRELMKCRYLDCKTWEEVAYKNGYSWQHTYRLHEKALNFITCD
nr:MAG TPA: Protein of unknown function (DUF722) [Caudoviricetes sp.]